MELCSCSGASRSTAEPMIVSRADATRSKAVYTVEVATLGSRPQVEALGVPPGLAAADIADRWGLHEGEQILLRRRHLADNQPTGLAQ
jgi:GntR family transcriptional regulator